jgi:hypothetical protein
MVLVPGFDAAHGTVARKRDTVGYHLALCDRRAETPGRADEHVAAGGFAQASTGGTGIDQGLNQHRHRGCGGVEVMVLHVAPRRGRPQSRPAGAHGRQECCLVLDAQEALELTCEIRVLAVLNEGAGAHHAGLAACCALGAPCRQKRVQNGRCDGLLVERQPNLD